MTKDEARKRIDKLRILINDYRYHYHVLDQSTMSEAAADSLRLTRRIVAQPARLSRTPASIATAKSAALLVICAQACVRSIASPFKALRMSAGAATQNHFA